MLMVASGVDKSDELSMVDGMMQVYLVIPFKILIDGAWIVHNHTPRNYRAANCFYIISIKLYYVLYSNHSLG